MWAGRAIHCHDLEKSVEISSWKPQKGMVSCLCPGTWIIGPSVYCIDLNLDMLWHWYYGTDIVAFPSLPNSSEHRNCLWHNLKCSSYLLGPSRDLGRLGAFWDLLKSTNAMCMLFFLQHVKHGKNQEFHPKCCHLIGYRGPSPQMETNHRPWQNRPWPSRRPSANVEEWTRLMKFLHSFSNVAWVNKKQWVRLIYLYNESTYLCQWRQI